MSASPRHRIVELSRDPFGRFTTVRRLVDQPDDGCAWCGVHNASQRMFQYGQAFDGGRIVWHTGAFCTIACYRAFHS